MVGHRSHGWDQRMGSSSSVGLWCGEGLWDGGVSLRGYEYLRVGV